MDGRSGWDAIVIIGLRARLVLIRSYYIRHNVFNKGAEEKKR